MYEQFYGFRTKPFSILPDSDFLYRSRGHRLALSMLEYGLGSQTGFTVITGEIGSGKTTLLQYLLKNSDPSHTIGYITNTVELNKDLMKWVLYAFDLRPSADNDVDSYKTFVDFVRKKFAEGRDCVLIIDEAQLLTAATLESIRLLSNINVGRDHILKMLLVGQPELLATLAGPDLVQFAQRVSANFHLKALSLMETREYIRTRLRIAGGDETLFDYACCDLIFAFSGGVPRQINILCDTTLVYGYADGRHRINIDTVIGVLHDRSAGKNLGTIKVPERFDLATAEAMIRAVREREIAQDIDSEPSSDVGGSPTVGVPGPRPDRAIKSKADAPTGLPPPTMAAHATGATTDPMVKPNPPRVSLYADRSAHAHDAAPIVPAEQFEPQPRLRNPAYRSPLLDSRVQLEVIREAAVESAPGRKLHRPAPAKDQRLEAGRPPVLPFQIYPVEDQGPVTRKSTSARAESVVAPKVQLDRPRSPSTSRRRLMWLVVLTVVILGVLFIGSWRLSLV